MSTRQLRKLQKQRELEQVQEELERESDGSEEVEDTSAPSRAKPNLFAALGGEEDDEAEDNDDDEPTHDSQFEQEQPQEPVAATKKSKKKKKKKKNKGKSDSPALEDKAEEDEIDKAVKALNLKTPDGPTIEEQQAARNDNMIFAVNPYHLKAINEMRNLFGREVIEAADAEEEQETNRRGRRQQMPRQVDLETFLREPPGAPKLPEVSLRRNLFIQGKEHWPKQSAGGLTMKEIQKAPDGSWTEYAYVHDTNYDGIQSFFFACVQVRDPMRMVHVLERVRKYLPSYCRTFLDRDLHAISLSRIDTITS